MARRPVVGAVAVAVLGTTAALLAWCARGLVAEAPVRGPASYDVMLGLAAAAAAGVCLAWLAAGALLIVIGSLRGAFAHIADSLALRLTPAAWRRTVHLALGAAIVAGPIGTATAWADGDVATPATDTGPDGLRSLPAIDRPAPDPAALPPVDRPGEGFVDQPVDQPVQPRVGQPPELPDQALPTTWTPTAPPAPTRIAPPADPLLIGSPRAAATVEEDVVVRRGDTLWHIAANHLGPGASAADIALEWPRWWSTNRDVIGGNPDLILPGQRLRPPS